MDELTGALAMKLVERLSDAEAKLILLAACRDGDIFKATQEVLDASRAPKKERKKWVKKEKGTSQSVPDPSALRDELPAPRKSRKTLKQRCKEMEANYPELWKRATENIGIMGNSKLFLEEFDRLFKEKK